MGTLSTIRNAKLVTTTERPVVSVPVQSPDHLVSPPTHPCPTCNSLIAWEAISGDGILRCDQCSPPPAKSFVERWWGLDGGKESGFAWVVIEKGSRGGKTKNGLSKETIEPAAEIDLSTLPPLTWSAPDIGGWCYGVDVEGKLNIRQHRLVMNGGLAIGEKWLTETEAEWQRRVKAVDEFWQEQETEEKAAAAAII